MTHALERRRRRLLNALRRADAAAEASAWSTGDDAKTRFERYKAKAQRLSKEAEKL
jgi:hypothetical protein